MTDVSLTIGGGESLALVGPSGCGKTTLLQMIGLLDTPDDGRVLLDGEDLWRLSARGRADVRLSRIGFVFQQNNLLPHLTARENVALPRWRLEGSRARALEAADVQLARFGLSARSAALAGVLSVGEAQRVAIARALVNEPRLVLADEPTGSLDSASASRVLEAFDAVIATGAGLLVVTHDPAVAARTGQTVTMRDGRRVEEADHAMTAG